jgi:exonuclease III
MNLKIIIIDEISMLKRQDFDHFNLTLQAIFDNEVPFGGISIIAVGDLMQLNPVGGNPIFETTTRNYSSLSPNYWKQLFKIHELTEIVRQKDDPHFAKILSRLRLNQCTESDYTKLSQLQQNTHIPTNAIHIFLTNAQVRSHNLTMMRTLKDTEQITIHASDSKKDLLTQTVSVHISETDPHKTGGLLEEIIIAKGARWMLTRNINIPEGLVNGSTGTIIDYNLPPNSPLNGTIYVQFDNPNIGKQLRKHNPQHLKNATPITAIIALFYLPKTSIPVQRKQYPGTLAWGITTHKSQGSTYTQFVANMTKLTPKSPVQQGLIYTMLSRGKHMNGIQIINFDKNMIRINEKAEQEIKRMTNTATLQCKHPCTTINKSTHTFAATNIRSLKAHKIDLQHDLLIPHIHIICLSETHLSNTSNHKAYNLKHHNLITSPTTNQTAIYLHKSMTYIQTSIDDSHIQHTAISTETSHGLTNIISIYNPPGSPITTFIEKLSNLLKNLQIHNTPCIVYGDFNYSLDHIDIISNHLQHFNLHQIITSPTHQLGSILDLIFTSIPNIQPQHMPLYYSDHHLLYFNLPKHNT